MPNGSVRRLKEASRKDSMAEDSVRLLSNLTPVFTGRTVNNEEITLYQHIDRPEEVHISLPNGELWQIEADGIKTWLDPMKQEMRVDIVSEVWTGQARGSRWDMLSASAR